MKIEPFKANCRTSTTGSERTNGERRKILTGFFEGIAGNIIDSTGIARLNSRKTTRPKTFYGRRTKKNEAFCRTLPQHKVIKRQAENHNVVVWTGAIASVLATTKIRQPLAVKTLAQRLKKQLHITALKRRNAINKREMLIVVSKSKKQSRAHRFVLALATKRPVTSTHHQAMQALTARYKVRFCKLTVTNKRDRHIEVLALPANNGMNEREFLRPFTSLTVNGKIGK